MGDAKRRARRFLAQNPTCAFCGGNAPATTIEHCPPRALFQNRQWPEGMEFPSCDDCNQGSRDQDLLIAMVGRFDPFTDLGNRDGHLPGLVKKVNERFPALLREMMPSPLEAKRSNRELKLTPPEGGTSQDTGVMKIPREVEGAVETLAEKLSKGLFYLETKSIFPNDGGLLFQWFTNANVIQEHGMMPFEPLIKLPGRTPVLKRSEKDLRDQFGYKFSVGENAWVFVLLAYFGKSFGFGVLGSTRTGYLENLAEQLTKETGRRAMKILGRSTGSGGRPAK